MLAEWTSEILSLSLSAAINLVACKGTSCAAHYPGPADKCT